MSFKINLINTELPLYKNITLVLEGYSIIIQKDKQILFERDCIILITFGKKKKSSNI